MKNKVEYLLLALGEISFKWEGISSMESLALIGYTKENVSELQKEINI